MIEPDRFIHLMAGRRLGGLDHAKAIELDPRRAPPPASRDGNLVVLVIVAALAIGFAGSLRFATVRNRR